MKTLGSTAVLKCATAIREWRRLGWCGDELEKLIAEWWELHDWQTGEVKAKKAEGE